MNEDRLCHVVRTKRVQARAAEMNRIAQISVSTQEHYAYLSEENAFAKLMQQIFGHSEE